MTIRGTVIKGEGIAGRLFGTPTANLVVGDMPPEITSGVYAGRVSVDGEVYDGAICYGADGKNKFEVHLLDFSADLIGRSLEVQIMGRVSDLLPWESEDQMRAKIMDDIRRIREIL